GRAVVAVRGTERLGRDVEPAMSAAERALPLVARATALIARHGRPPVGPTMDTRSCPGGWIRSASGGTGTEARREDQRGSHQIPTSSPGGAGRIAAGDGASIAGGRPQWFRPDPPSPWGADHG